LDIIKKEQYLRGVLLLWIAASLPTRYANAIIFLKLLCHRLSARQDWQANACFQPVRSSVRPSVRLPLLNL